MTDERRPLWLTNSQIEMLHDVIEILNENGECLLADKLINLDCPEFDDLFRESVSEIIISVNQSLIKEVERLRKIIERKEDRRELR